jgi:GNAT superfamily N-acetyltransferase
MPPDLAIRRVGEGDARRVQQFVRQLSAHARTERYFAPIRELSPRQLERVTHARQPGDVALAVTAGDDLVGLAECCNAEFAVVVADAWQGMGIGEALMQAILSHAENMRLPSVHGVVRERNRPMLRLARRLGFDVAGEIEPGLVRVERRLDALEIGL